METYTLTETGNLKGYFYALHRSRVTEMIAPAKWAIAQQL
jgi:hypothetical protein